MIYPRIAILMGKMVTIHWKSGVPSRQTCTTDLLQRQGQVPSAMKNRAEALDTSFATMQVVEKGLLQFLLQFLPFKRSVLRNPPGILAPMRAGTSEWLDVLILRFLAQRCALERYIIHYNSMYMYIIYVIDHMELYIYIIY